MSLPNPVQHKAVVKRYMDSLLAKINKLRALIKDLKKNYSADSAGKLWFIYMWFIYAIKRIGQVVAPCSSILAWSWSQCSASQGQSRPWRTTSPKSMRSTRLWMSTWPLVKPMAMVGSSVLRKSVTVTHLKIAHPDIFVSVAPRWWSAAEKKMKEATMVFGSQISQIIYVPLLFVSSSCFVICLKCCLMISRPKKTIMLMRSSRATAAELKVKSWP